MESAQLFSLTLLPHHSSEVNKATRYKVKVKVKAKVQGKAKAEA